MEAYIVADAKINEGLDIPAGDRVEFHGDTLSSTGTHNVQRGTVTGEQLAIGNEPCGHSGSAIPDFSKNLAESA